MADVDCIRTFFRIHYFTSRRRLVHHQPSSPSCRRSRSRGRQDRRSRRRLVPAGLCHHPSLFLKVHHHKISQCSPNKDGGRRLYTDLLPHTLPHQSPPSRSSPAVAAVLSPVSSSSSGPPVSSPSRPHRTLSPSAAFPRSPPSQNFINVRQTKMADVDCIQTYFRIHYPTGRRRFVRHQLSSPSCRRSRSRYSIDT